MVNWLATPFLNCKDLTLQWIQDALAQDIPVNVLLIDNGSTDGTSKAIADLGDPRIHLVINDTNLGVGPAWNQICDLLFGQIITSDPVNHIMITNNDIRMRPDMYRHLLIPNGGFVTGVNAGSVDRMLSETINISPEPIMKGGPDYSCFLIKKWFWDVAGRFPECYWPGWFEDRDHQMLCIGKGLGPQMYGVPVPYYHIVSQSIRTNPELKRINDVMFPQNKALYVLRWGGEPHRETFSTPQSTYFIPRRPTPEQLAKS